jgi:hypothetical protein
MIYFLFYNIFSNGTKNVQEGSRSGRIRNKLASWIRTRASDLRIRESGTVINIYGSGRVESTDKYGTRTSTLYTVPYIKFCC